MCDHAHYEVLEARLDDHEKRLVRIETAQDELKGLVREGFADTKAQFHDLYADRIQWNDWARHALTAVGQWLGKWGGIIILAAIGLGNTPRIIDAISKHF